MAAASPYGKGMVGLLKKGWNEIPGVMGSTVMAIIGLGLGITGIRRYVKNDKIAPTYKKSYTGCTRVGPGKPLTPCLRNSLRND